MSTEQNVSSRRFSVQRLSPTGWKTVDETNTKEEAESRCLRGWRIVDAQWKGYYYCKPDGSFVFRADEEVPV